jgi:hypothetical protein
MSRSEAAFVFGVVSEAKSDQRIACGLAERVSVERIDWLESESLPGLCQWRGFEGGTDYLAWNAIERSAKRRGLVTHPRFNGAFDERPARLALFLFNSLGERPEAVVLVRDTDDVDERVSSLKRARDERPWPFAVVLATPATKRECWVLNGFVPRNRDEKAALERVRRKLGFDPCSAGERLTAKRKRGKNNAKLILERDLGVQPGSDREDACWRETDLDVLRARGRGTLLAGYLEDVVDRLVPILASSHGTS